MTEQRYVRERRQEPRDHGRHGHAPRPGKGFEELEQLGTIVLSGFVGSNIIGRRRTTHKAKAEADAYERHHHC